MKVLHTYVLNRDGSVERTYDLLQNDGNIELTGTDVFIKHTDNRPEYFKERDAINYVKEMDYE